MAYTAWSGGRPDRSLPGAGRRGDSESYARERVHVDGQAAGGQRDEADEILAGQAKAGWGCGTWPSWPRRSGLVPSGRAGPGPGRGFDDRSVKIQTTFQGAGVLHGDLTPECAASCGAVLDALGGLAGKRGRPEQGAAVPRRAPRGDAPPGRRGGCCRSGPGSRLSPEGPGSRSRPWSTSAWPGCSTSTAGPSP